MTDTNGAASAPSASESARAVDYLSIAGSALQTPLDVLHRHLDALKAAGAALPPELRTHLTALNTATRQLDEVTRDLHHVTRAYEARKTSPAGENIDMAALINTVLDELRPLADECLVTFQVYLPDVFPAIHSHEGTLYAAIYHLILNAIVFNLPGGLVRVEAVGELSGVTLHILDTGLPIPQSEWETIFEAVRQRETESAKAHSRGLGLPIARRALAHVGGSVEIAHSGRGGTALRVRIPAQHKDAEARLAEVQSDLESVHRQSLAYAHDLRQVYRRFRALNAELESANERLEATNRLKSNFLAIISHELRSPFATLGMAIELFAQYGLDNLTPDQRDLYDQIALGAHQARQMVDHLLKAADLLSRETTLRLEPVELAALVQDTAVASLSLAERRGLKLSVDAPPRLVAPAIDRQMVSDALWQLIDNALKFTPAGGSVLIRLAQVDERAVIEVADTGPGIPPARQTTLWEAFSQLADPLQRGMEGIGLGLALVRLVALKHGGNVLLQSAPGEGSVFGFWLPLNDARSEDGQTPT
ncbi:MAG: HAMP domain-containing histidine kinase [Anaerolineae bacterium]|nr:HAMP domain-containing histidine kinase [Anaerolineae bacterium]